MAAAPSSDAEPPATSDESSSDDDSLVLEGELMRHPDAPESSSSDEDENPKKQPSTSDDEKPPPRKKTKKNEPDILQVEFSFFDMQEQFFHGIKALLPHNSSSLVNTMIQNVAVGTVVSADDAVFGFASVLNVSTYQETEGIQLLKKLCLDGCPNDRQEKLQVVLSGQTKQPAGFLLHGRMINLPLEIVLVLHQQLEQDLDWAAQQKDSHDFGVLIRLAPCTKEKGSLVVHRFFDDEVLAGRADFTYTVDGPQRYSSEEKEFLQVIVLTKQGHREALRDLEKMIGR